MILRWSWKIYYLQKFILIFLFRNLIYCDLWKYNAMYFHNVNKIEIIMNFFIKEQIFNFIINRILVKFYLRKIVFSNKSAFYHFINRRICAKSIIQKLISSWNIKMHQQCPRALFIRWPGISLLLKISMKFNSWWTRVTDSIENRTVVHH